MKNAVKLISLLIALIVGGGGYYGLTHSTSSSHSYNRTLGVQTSSPQSPVAANLQNNPSVSATTPIGQRTKTSGCVSQNGLPDSSCTPGAIIQGVTKDQVCTSGYSKSVRNVPTQIKDEVYREYGIASHQPGQYEVDHLISLELGGSNDISNLWPEPADPRPGFHEKDKVENYLNAQVCNGSITLEQAQTQISSNWFDVYKKISP